MLKNHTATFHSIPRNAQTARVGITPTLNRSIASQAATATTATKASNFPPSGHSAWRANQSARLRITPTTAAVIAASAPDSRRSERSRSMYGAPTLYAYGQRLFVYNPGLHLVAPISDEASARAYFARPGRWPQQCPRSFVGHGVLI